MQTIGERLEDARKKKGISIREAAEATKIRGEYLQKFEGNQFDIGLTEIYTRGFLRGYASYLRIPSERIMSDYTSLRGGEPRIRQPSREVYGRMDLAISSADERGDTQAESVATEVAHRPHTRFPRPGENLPKSPAIDPALMFKAGKYALFAAVLLVLVLLTKWYFSAPGVTAAPTRATAPITSDAGGPAATITVVATEPVRVKVVRKSDGAELFQGPLQAGERREYANVPLYLTASELGSVEIEYKGRRYPTNHSGHERIQFDFSNVR